MKTRFLSILRISIAILKRLYILAAAKAPSFFRNKVVILDNIADPCSPCFDGYVLYKHLKNSDKYKGRVYYIVSKEFYKKSTRNLKCGRGNGIIPVVDGKIPFKLYLLLPFIKYWIDSYQLFYWIGLSRYLENFNGISIYSQHGVNAFKASGLMNAYISDIYFDYFVCSSVKEADFVEPYYLYTRDRLPLLGLLRWDSLRGARSALPSQGMCVFCYFTYRDYLRNGSEWIDYYRWKLQELVDCLNFLGYKVKFAFHHCCPSSVKRLDGCIVVSEGEIFNVKLKSDILITDFSSICFDFAFMAKRSIFYLFDWERKNEFPPTDRINILHARKVLQRFPVAYSIESIKKILTDGDAHSFARDYLKDFLDGLDNQLTICDRYMEFLGGSPKRKRGIEFPGKARYFVNKSQQFVFNDLCPIFNRGFGAVEVDSQGCQYRWSYSRMCTFLFAISAGSWIVEFDTEALLAGILRRNAASIYVNRVRVDEWVFQLKSNRSVRVVLLSNGTDENKNIRIDICIKSIFSPRDLMIGEDRRELGVKLYSISFKRIG